MKNDYLIGNEAVRGYLKRLVEKKQIANSLLFAGPEGIGKSLFAVDFAKQLFCADDSSGNHAQKIDAGNHPDLHIYKPEGKIGLHGIKTMRQFSQEVYLPPYEAQYKVFIIHDADRMLPYSANALLKTFEEPALDAIIILLSSSPESLLPTIISRCRTIRFESIPEAEITAFLQGKQGKSPQEAVTMARLSKGSLGKALLLAQKGENHQRALLMKILSKGKRIHYVDLTRALKELNDLLEEEKKQVEQAARDGLQGDLAELNAVQREAVEKEIEGAVAIRFAAEADALFEGILSWYRDLHLLQTNASPTLLFNSDYEPQLREALKENIPSLEHVQKLVAEAKLASNRSIKLSSCLEALFLKKDEG